MSNSLCKSSVYKAYQEVIKDVITNVKEHFLEDGVDEQVLQELKQLWETKLTASKAVDESKEVDKILSANNRQPQRHDLNNGVEYQRTDYPTHPQLRQVVGQVPPNNHMPHSHDCRRIPIQLTLPAVPGSGETQRVLLVEVPDIFLQAPGYLKWILTGQVVSTTMGLPHAAASNFLQQHINAAFKNHQDEVAMGMRSNFVRQVDGSNDDEEVNFRVLQGDAPMDTSDEDDVNNESDEIEEEKDEEDVEEEATGPEEEPLNSGDDVSDPDDANDSFETDNVIVCQYDKISRCRNRWKFHLKDGIMNLNGEDYVFQKANGDAEW